jgi:creatinine amidohydrolase
VELASLAWPAVAARASSSILAAPLGSTEQHGPHLPLATDTSIAVELAARLAAARDDVLVAPPMAFGSSGEHAGFAGTLSIGLAAVEMVLVELVRSADAFRGVVIVSGHGGNAAAVDAAVRRLRGEGRAVVAWSYKVPGGDAHAGRTETSLMLAIDPGSVDLSLAAAGSRQPLASLMGALRRSGVAAVSPNGVLGDPAGATADEGAALLSTFTDSLVARVAEEWPE